MSSLSRLLTASIAASALLAISPLAPALAEVNHDPKEAEAADALTGAETLAMAASLYEAGLMANDPILVIAAAKLSASVELDELTAEPGAEPVEEAEAVAEATEEDAAPPGTAEMLAAARDLAADAPALLAMIDEIGTIASRAPVRGTLSGTKRLPPRTQHYYDIELRARERTTITLDGGNDGNLDLFVHDENGNLICQSRRYGDRERCTVRPRWQGYFRVYVKNLTRHTNTYRLVVR
ncbi:MAG: PPC domain-containing protein [Pseudomonadota bacterium]